MKTVCRISLVGACAILLGVFLLWLWQGRKGGMRAQPATRLSAAGRLEIVRKPSPLLMLLNRGALKELPPFNPKSGKNW